MLEIINPLFEIEECVGVSLKSMDEQFHDDKYEIYYLVKGNVGYFINGNPTT